MSYPTPHYEKLLAAKANEKLPSSDIPRIDAAIARYREWVKALNAVTGKTPKEIVTQMVSLLNAYSRYIAVELIFDSPGDFLHRQKGQLKLDNSIIEEFLPRLICPAVLPEMKVEVEVGPTQAYSAAYFESSLSSPMAGGGLRVRGKDQDFAISKKLYLRASHKPDFHDATTAETCIAYVAAECKTNLDKTMFQEACATAHDLKTSVPGSKYFLLCEWLDMTPLSTAPTDIEEVLLLRKAKRMNSNIRKNFDTSAKRKDNRKTFTDHIDGNPYSVDSFLRLVDHIRKLLVNEELVEKDVLEQGYF